MNALPQCPQKGENRNPAEAVAQHISEDDVTSNTNHTTSPACCQGQNDVAKEEQPMSHPTLGIIPDEARRLAAYGVDSDRIPAYRIHNNESFKARLVGMLAQNLMTAEMVATPDGEERKVEMSLNRYRVHLEDNARMEAMSQPHTGCDAHPAEGWHLTVGRAFDLRFLLQVITDMVSDNWAKWAQKSVTNPLTMGELARAQYDKALHSLADELADGIRAMPEFSNFVELAQRTITGEGLVNFVIDNDAKDYDVQLKRLVSQCKRRGDKVEPIEIPDSNNNDEVIVKFLGRLFVVPKMYTVIKGEYTLWDNREVAKTINWLISNGQMHIAIELVLQMPIVEQSRNKYLDSLSRNWASQPPALRVYDRGSVTVRPGGMFMHAPALATGLRNGLGHKWLDTRVTLQGNKVIKGEYDPRIAKLVPIRELSFTEQKSFTRLYKNIAHLFPFGAKSIKEEDGTVKEVSVEEQWVELLEGIGPTNPNWLKKGKGMLGDILHDTKADPGKTGKRVRPFTGGAFWALIPSNYTAKLIGEPLHREKFIRMAAEVDIELTDDDFSKMIVKETPFDAKGGIYVSEWLASHIIVEQKDGAFQRLTDGDKFTRLVHGNARFARWFTKSRKPQKRWAVLVKGLVHIMPDNQMDADIILGEDCLKFFANDDLVQDNRYDLIVSDIAADYLNLDWLRASPMIMAHYPEFYVELVKREIAQAGLKELCQGVATVDDIVDVLSFVQFDDTIRTDPVGQMVANGMPITYEGNWGHHDNNWWKYLRQRIQQILSPRFFGIGGKLVVAPDNLKVRSWLDERWIDDDDDGCLPGWQEPMPLPRTAISVPADVYHAILQHFGERDREWLKMNKGIIAAQCAYPFTGRHGLVKVRVYAHDSRHRCVFVGADLLDLVERDCDGDPEVAFLDREFIERCAVSYEYAREVRDKIAEFHGHVELGEPLCLADMEKAISNAVSSLYQKDITISKKNWMSKTQPVYNIPGRKQLTRMQLWYKTWAAWCDCPICGDGITRWYLRYPDGHFHHVGRTDEKYEAAHRAFIRAEKDHVTVGEITFTDESVARYFHAQLDVIEKPVATGDTLRISAVHKLIESANVDVPVEIEDNDPSPQVTQEAAPVTTASSSPAMKEVTIYTDGGSRKGIGGFGVVLISGEHSKEMSESLGEGVTNQAAELHAAIAGLKALKSPERCAAQLITDSKYVIGWVTGEYKNLSKSPNVDLIHSLLDLRGKCGKFDAQWVKGHAGNEYNERCDAKVKAKPTLLATMAIEKANDDNQLSLVNVPTPIKVKKAWNPTCTKCGKTIAGGIAGDRCKSSSYKGFHRIDTADPAVKGIYCKACGVVHDDTMFTADGESYCDTCFCNGVYPRL